MTDSTDPTDRQHGTGVPNTGAGDKHPNETNVTAAHNTGFEDASLENPAFQNRFEQTRDPRPREQTEDTQDGVVDDTVPVDPVTDGNEAVGTREGDVLGGLGDDALADDLMEKQTVTNDAVAGETVFEGDGPGGSGPGGEEPVPLQPSYPERDADDPEITLMDETADAERPPGPHGVTQDPEGRAGA